MRQSPGARLSRHRRAIDFAYLALLRRSSRWPPCGPGCSGLIPHWSTIATLSVGSSGRLLAIALSRLIASLGTLLLWLDQWTPDSTPTEVRLTKVYRHNIARGVERQVLAQPGL